jgi:ABC-2 type transport system permease protein
MRQFLVVIRFKLLAGLKSVFGIRRDVVTREVASFLVLAGFSVAIFFFARFVTSYLLKDAHIGLFLFHRFLSMVLFVFFLTINLGNMIVAYSTLYKSDEVSFLLTHPISFEKIFIVKFLDNFFHSSSTLFIVGVSVLAGYGSVFGMPLTFYLFVLVAMVMPFMLLAAALAVTLLLGLMKLATKVNPRQLIMGLLIVYLASVYFYFHFTNPMQLTEEVMKFYPNVNEYFSQFDPKFVAYLPNHWVADSLYFLVRGDTSAALPYIVVLILGTLGSVLLCLFLASRLYYSTWIISRELLIHKRPRLSEPIRLLRFQTPSFLNSQTEVLLKKDFWQFFREPSQWLHLLILFFLIVVFLVSIMTLKLKMTLPFLQTVSYLIVMTFNGFLIASVALRFVFPVVSLEGQAFWSVRSAPVYLRKVYRIKFIVGLAFVLVVAEFLSFLSNYPLHEHSPLLLATLGGSLALSIGLVALNLAAGAYFADYREKNAIRIASSQGASLTFLLNLGFLILPVLLFFIPIHRYFEHIIFGRPYVEAPLFVALGVALLISVIIAAIASFVGLRSFERDF